MELKAGYKQTEVGVIPEDWEVKRLKNISPSQSVGLVINPSSYFSKNGTVPMLVGSHVYENEIKYEKANRITEESNMRLPASRLKSGDLVTVRVGDPGVTAVIPSELDGCNCASMMIVRQGKTFDSTWLCYLMNSQVGRSQVEGVQYGTAQKQFNIIDAVDFLFPFPSKTEQTAIANALSDADALIQSLTRLIAKKRQIKQGAMQTLLNPYENGRLKAGWVVKKLGDVSHVEMGQSPSSKNYNKKGNGLPLVQGNADIKNRETIIRTYTSEITKRCNTGDIIMSVRAPVGETAVATFDACIGRGVCAIKYPNKYIYHYLVSIEESWGKLSKGSTFDSVNSTEVKALEIYLPKDEAEQTRISTILSDMDADIAALETKLAKYQQIKQGMMQNLLTGRIRLVKPETKAGAAA